MHTGFVRAIVLRLIAIRRRLFRRARSTLLKARWSRHSSEYLPSKPEEVETKAVFDRVAIVAVNLESRPDRLEELTKELRELGIGRWRRVSALDGRAAFPALDSFFSGSVGCSLSHVLALQPENWEGREALLILEDDVEFLVNKTALAHSIHEFLENPAIDVLALYGKSRRGGSHRISSNLQIVSGLVGTVCYVVKPHMGPVIANLFMHGVPALMRGRRNGKSDILWNRLQVRKYFFAAPNAPHAQNRAGFSDIERRMLGPR